jgi:phosphogluconate dehydratase
MPLHPVVAEVTERIVRRSHESRTAYLELMQSQRRPGARRRPLPCANHAHGTAGASEPEKQLLARQEHPNIGIVTAYNDMLSAHQPYGQYPARIKEVAARHGATAQVAGGVPAMCDGITQGLPGMELSLLSRDVIAMSTAVALSHDMFDAVLCLGICDKIVPGLLIGVLRFGFLPVVFVPAGPMPSGLPNSEKARVRQQYAEGKATRDELMQAEQKSYHSPGTCTFYGTANSNQMLMEIMGLQLPGGSFVNPGTPLRDALTAHAVDVALQGTLLAGEYRPIMDIVSERSLVNALIGLLATGGSTNHTLHLIAMAKSAGIFLTWQDMADLSAVIPLLARIYPNGKADVNQFHAAGGMGFIIGQLLDQGLLHEDVDTIIGHGLSRYRMEPVCDNAGIAWRPAASVSADDSVLSPVTSPFQAEGGLRVLDGNLGRAVIKVSAVPRENWRIEAPARVFDSQEAVLEAFRAGELDRDVVVVLRGQGPRACGMPELHKLTPALGVLQDRGYRIALVTDGRMSGASGKVPAAIHVCPEAAMGGSIARIREGDVIIVDALENRLQVEVPDDVFLSREPAMVEPSAPGLGRELFAHMREFFSSAEDGASILL